MTSLRAPAVPLGALLAALLGACASAPSEPPAGEPVPVPGLEKRFQEAEEAAAKTGEIQRVLVSLDQALESYVTNLANKGVIRSDKQRERLESYLRKTVNDDFERLVSVAGDSSDQINRGIALAALGFADYEERREAMTVILDGVQSEDPATVDKAVLGLAILRDPRTPPGVLMDVIDNEKMPEASRTQAAWALHEIQEVSPRTEEIVGFWTQLLEKELTVVVDGVVAQAVRGIGLTRDKALAPLVVKYASHPAPKVREMTAIALGRMKNLETVEALLALIGPAENNPNVRLAARKALQALAGGKDREYDVEEWRKVFELGF